MQKFNKCGCCGRFVPRGLKLCRICNDDEFDGRPYGAEALGNFLRNCHTGKDNVINCGQLCAYFGLDESTIHRYVKKLRMQNVPICSCREGYYYAENQDEINNTVAWLNGMVTGVSNSRTSLLYAVLTKQAKKKKVKKIRIVMEQEEGENEEISIVVEN